MRAEGSRSADRELHSQRVDRTRRPRSEDARAARRDSSDPRGRAVQPRHPVPPGAGSVRARRRRRSLPRALVPSSWETESSTAISSSTQTILKWPTTSSARRFGARSPTCTDRFTPAACWFRSTLSGCSSRSIATRASDFESLAWAVQETLALHDALIAGVSRRIKQGIDIVDAPAAFDEDTGPPICKVCGEPISGGVVVVCAACHTPHHRDCWDYVGACSIYGCSGKVGVRT